jgi:hypothetical protein
MTTQNKTISWEAHEFRHYPKNAGWYVGLVIITVLTIAFFVIYEHDIFAAVSLGIIAILIFLFSRQTPNRVEIELNSKGVRFDKLFYPYQQLKYFWVVKAEHHKTINLHTSALVNNIVILELEDQDPEAARQYLLQYLPEHPETEPTPVQKIMHKFKF